VPVEVEMKNAIIAAGLCMLAVSAQGQMETPMATDELARRFRQADRDGDGKLSPAEAQQASWFVDEVDRFERIDRDRSGTVTLAEIGEAIAAEVAGWLGADTDKDGRVSETEAKTQGTLADRFSSADADRNGMVTRDEIERLSQRSYYRDAELPAIAPNIIEKRF
jgi:Ca2+-binding EF-hand superfamily protein